MEKTFSFTPPDNFIRPKFANEEVIIESAPASTCEKVKEFRGNLIANVTHDLRTPLQSIIGYSETILLKQQNLPLEEQQKYLEVILLNANKLSSMIENFFEYSKLEVSEVIPVKASFPAKKMVDELCENYKLIASEREVDISISLAEGLAPIHGDYQMLYRVFQNLIDNALKFTPKNGKISVRLLKGSENEILAEISDTGTGIPHGELDLIFNKFKMTKNTVTGVGQNDGLGLGLAIVKKILSLHDSKIFVNSEVGIGTTFKFSLPVG